MPATAGVNARASVTAGLAKEVEAVHRRSPKVATPSASRAYEPRPHSIEVSSANLPRVRCFARNSMQTLIFGKAAARAAVAAQTFATSL